MSDGIERVTLAVDTSERSEAEHLIGMMHEAGAARVKLGLQAITAIGARELSEMVPEGMGWVADQKLKDISNTELETVQAYTQFNNPPEAITVHADSSLEAMRVAQETAGSIKMLGVTVLTDIDNEEAQSRFGATRLQLVQARARDAAQSGLAGLVAAPTEVRHLTADSKTASMLTMIPGTRSFGAQKHDQRNSLTPAQAILDGADWLVIGRQVTKADNPEQALLAVNQEIEKAEILREKLLAFRQACLDADIKDRDGLHQEFNSGMHGQKLDYDVIHSNPELMRAWAQLLVEYICLGDSEYKQPDLVVSVANGTNLLVEEYMAEEFGGEGPVCVASGKFIISNNVEMYLPDRAIDEILKIKEKAHQENRPVRAKVIEDVGTTGTSALRVITKLGLVGVDEVEVLNTWQRQPQLVKLEKAGIPYRSLNFEPLPTFEPDECERTGFCSRGWEYIPRKA